MTMRRCLSLAYRALSILALAWPLPLCARDSILVLDPAQTQVTFTLNDVLHTVHGTFKLKQGSIEFDPATGKATGSIVVDTTSGYSGSAPRDRRMHRDILESSRYPEMVFIPSRILGNLSPQGKSQLQLEGLMQVHGAEHPLTVQVTVQISGDQVTAESHFVIPYVHWGMKNPSTFLLRVSDRVDLEVHTAGRLTVAPAS